MCNCKHTAADFKLASEAPFNSTLIEVDSEWMEIGLQDVEYMEENFPDTFSIPEKEIRESIPVGMMAKVIVDWGIEDVPNERFWFEVASTQVDDVGNLAYFGVLRNDTIVAPWGAMMGPIYAWNICDVDAEECFNRNTVGCSCDRCQQVELAA
ncbi:hypothetical protein ICN32_10150 [Polynucleobacter wuianus]|uniref:hypothetical protein n=1 Tax=Polynucleobacter wuianus TaxID=1743168 RepID=UPI001C0CB86D|nr:hypothetical protein [Polynucleobacter wuianus]MBU3610914.1 hypothetical protein [Polynucleobacter wuianus]